jgi:hypothetical protein
LGVSRRGGTSAIFPLRLYISWSPPLALEVTGDLDEEERGVGRSGYDLGAGSTGCNGGIDEQLREKGFLRAFPLLFSTRPKSRGS